MLSLIFVATEILNSDLGPAHRAQLAGLQRVGRRVLRRRVLRPCDPPAFAFKGLLTSKTFSTASLLDTQYCMSLRVYVFSSLRLGLWNCRFRLNKLKISKRSPSFSRQECFIYPIFWEGNVGKTW